MKRLVVTLALAALSASAYSEDGWVSVGSTRVVAPASPDTIQPESSSAPLSVSPSLNDNAPVGSNGLLAELMMKVTQMQDEIAMLRGQVEMQQAKINRMEAASQDRYIDLDGRISALSTMATEYPSAPATTDADTAPVTGQADENKLPPSGDAYKAAMELVRGKKFAEARVAFDDFTKNYPGDPLAVNALYWAGEVSLVEGKTDVAQARFRTIVEEHPDHAKVADATYKLGVALERAGKPEEARGYLQSVIDKYTGKSDSTVALAKSYMKKLPAKAQATAE